MKGSVLTFSISSENMSYKMISEFWRVTDGLIQETSNRADLNTKNEFHIEISKTKYNNSNDEGYIKLELIISE